MTEQATREPGEAMSGSEVVETQHRGGADHSELTKQVGTLQTVLERKTEQIKGDRRLTREEIKQQLVELWDKGERAHGELLQRYDADLEERSADAERGVFHVGGQQLQDSVRSAYNDVYYAVSPGFGSSDPEGMRYAQEELERLWERAERTGDRALQIAVGHVATERGIADIRDKWLATSEEKSKKWQRYVEARTRLDSFRDPRQRIEMTAGGLNLRKPPELWGEL